MTPVDLETFIRQSYNAVGDDHFSQAEIFNYIQRGETELALETRCIRAVYTTTSVSGQRAYDFPTYAFAIFRAQYNGKRILPSDFVDDDILTGNQPEETLTGESSHYQIFNDNVYLRPIPDGANTIKFYTANYPQTITANGSLNVPARYHHFLSDYALYRMCYKDQKFQIGNAYLAAWKESKALVLQTERIRQTTDGFITVKDVDDLWEESAFE